MREDYSADGDAWSYLTYDDARSRTYRWGEDGIAGVSDTHGLQNIAFAFWNGEEYVVIPRIVLVFWLTRIQRFSKGAPIWLVQSTR